MAGQFLKKISGGRARNIMALVLGLGLGQGSQFAVQTYLLARGQIEFVGLMGIALLVVLLLVQIIDWGAQLNVARAYINDGLDAGRRALLAFTVFRALLFIVFAGVFFWALHTPWIGMSKFTADFTLACGLGLFLLVFNLSGLLDGMQKAGINGAMTALPYVSLAIAQLLIPVERLPESGFILGLAYSLGVLLGIIVQYAMVIKSVTLRGLFSPKGAGFNFAFFREAVLDGGANTLTLIPGQLFFRAQVFALSYLGLSVVAAFLYAKQLANIAAQIAAFARRTELVQYKTSEFALSLRGLSRYASFIVAVLISGGLMLLAVLSLVVESYLPEDSHIIREALLWLAPTVVSSALVGILSTLYAIRIEPRLPAMVMMVTAALGAGFLIVFADRGTIALAALAEFGVHFAQFAALLILLMKAQSRAAPQKTLES